MENKRLAVAQLFLAIAACSFAGCQTWTGGFPLSSPARVPPPGTGTYQLPPGYYKNSSTSPSDQAAQGLQGQYQTASNNGAANNGAPNNGSSTFRTVSGALPTTNLGAAGGVQPASFSAQSGSVGASSMGQHASGGVSQANYVTPNFARENTSAQNEFSSGTGTAGSLPSLPRGAASASLSDTSSEEIPSLQWQP